MKLFTLIFTLIFCYSAATTCKETRDELTSKHLVGAYIPQCQKGDESKYNILQCHASTWYCWCVDEITNEAYTQQFRPEETDNYRTMQLSNLCDVHKIND